MSFVRKLIAGAALCLALSTVQTKAAVHVVDLGLLAPDTTVAFSGNTGTGAFTEIFKFSVASAGNEASVSYSDSVRFASRLITGGQLALFSCLTNCSGSSVPTGSLVASAPVINLTATVQSAAIESVLLSTAGFYYLALTGTTAAPAPGVTYAGTISVASAVPEPATWAMMLVGFAGLGFAARRKSATIAA